MSLMGNIVGSQALAAHGKHQYDKAIKLYHEAYAKGMNKPRLLRGYSVLLIRMGQLDRALEVLKEIEKLPGLTDKEKVDLHVNYAIVLFEKGHHDHAMEILMNEFAHQKNGTMYSIIGYLKVEMGDAQDALAFNQEALAYDESDPVFLDNMAQTYYRLLFDKETAKTYFDRAIALKPSAIDTNYFLALYDIEAGELQSARAHLETSRAGFFSPLNYATPALIDEQLKRLDAMAEKPSDTASKEA